MVRGIAMTTIELLRRRIELKKQIIKLAQGELTELEAKLDLSEVEQDEKPCHVWDLTGGEG